MGDVKDKNSKLGENFSTACHKLRRSIMFDLVSKCGLNKCHRCGKTIESDDDMSIDHIVDWLHADDPKGLFYDVNNIAFSHKACNRPSSGGTHVVKSRFGYRGVRYDERRRGRKRWEATVYANNKNVYVGLFETAKEAAEAHDKKMIELFGESAVTNKSLGKL